MFFLTQLNLVFANTLMLQTKSRGFQAVYLPSQKRRSAVRRGGSIAAKHERELSAVKQLKHVWSG